MVQSPITDTKQNLCLKKTEKFIYESTSNYVSTGGDNKLLS